MFLVGGRFDDPESARAALRQLQDSVAHAPGDLGLRPLGSVRYEHPARGLIVAGRFADGDVERVVDILERHGGTIVFRREEWRDPSPGGTTAGRNRSARCGQVSGGEP
jgi:hypothetical protein